MFENIGYGLEQLVLQADAIREQQSEADAIGEQQLQLGARSSRSRHHQGAADEADASGEQQLKRTQSGSNS